MSPLKGVSLGEWEYFKALISFQPDNMNGHNIPTNFTTQTVQTEKVIMCKGCNNSKIFDAKKT